MTVILMLANKDLLWFLMMMSMLISPIMFEAAGTR